MRFNESREGAEEEDDADTQTRTFPWPAICMHALPGLWDKTRQGKQEEEEGRSHSAVTHVHAVVTTQHLGSRN